MERYHLFGKHGNNAIVEAVVSKIILSAVCFVFLPIWGIEIRLEENAKMACQIFLLSDICLLHQIPK